MTEYAKPICDGCGKEIEFVKLRNHKGEIKNHPVEVEKKYLIVLTDDRTQKGQFIYKSIQMRVSHFDNCPAAKDFREKGKSSNAPKESEQNEAEQKSNDDDKPPF